MSRFVSGGTFSDDPSASTPAEPTTSTTSTDRDEAWTKAQAAIDATKQQKKTEAGGAGLQEGGKTLYETLQANKGDTYQNHPHSNPFLPCPCQFEQKTNSTRSAQHVRKSKLIKQLFRETQPRNKKHLKNQHDCATNSVPSTKTK